MGAERKDFGIVTRDLLIEQGITTSIGNPDWMTFAKSLDGVLYESLRKAVSGERPPSAKIMETVAAKLGVEPTIYWEYRLWLAQRAFDPKEVGVEVALANLERWAGEA